MSEALHEWKSDKGGQALRENFPHVQFTPFGVIVTSGTVHPPWRMTIASRIALAIMSAGAAIGTGLAVYLNFGP